MGDCTCHDSGVRKTNRGNLGRAVEQREAARRIAEAARTEINRYYGDQKFFDSAATNMLKDDFKRKAREFKERSDESSMLENVYQNERQKALNAIRSEEEERMALALAKRQQDKERQDKEIQKLREQSNELRDLADKIKTARITKERAEQLVEKKALQEQQQEYDQAFNQFIKQNDAAAAQREAAVQAQRRDDAVRARMVLEEQMAEKQELMRQAEAEHVRERAMIDEVVKRIMEEDLAEVALRRNKQDETKRYIEVFLTQQDELKRREEEARVAEDKKIADYWAVVKEREVAEAERAAMRKEVADRMYEKVKREMEEEMRRREEEEELINMLQQEELEDKRRQEDAARKAKAEKGRADMVAANQQQMLLKAQREEAFKREEEDFRAKMLAKFAEDDRIEQMNAQKRRMRLAEHAREVQRMVEEKRRMFEEQKAREEAAEAARRAEDGRVGALVEEERKKLLREAAELKDFLPKGVLRDRADVDYIEQVLAEMAQNRAKGGR